MLIDTAGRLHNKKELMDELAKINRVIGKDGGVKLRKASPWDVREITRVIDKTPSRQREVRDLRQP